MSHLADLSFRNQIPALAETIVQRQYALQPGQWEAYGASGLEHSVRDAGYHLTYLAEALDAGSPALFTEYVIWVKGLFAGLNLPEDTISTALELTRQVLTERLAPEAALLVQAILDAGLKSLDTAPAIPASFIAAKAPLADLAQGYLNALLAGNRNAASAMILQAAQSVPVRDIYLHVFQPSQHEIGRLWQTNQISIAQEHFCTAATQMIMSQLYPYIFTGERKNRRVIVACVGGELHEIGARMVADFFEMAGWDSYFLGASTPPGSILKAIEDQQADLLAVSATMTFHVRNVADLIAALRHSNGRQPRILVGGYPFNIAPTLWEQIGADGYASDADTAIREAERLLTA